MTTKPTLREALAEIERVIERLQMDIDDGSRPDQWSMESMVHHLNIARATLAQHEAQPVAWLYQHKTLPNKAYVMERMNTSLDGAADYREIPLYASPPQEAQQGANPTMTRDELVAAAESIGMRFQEALPEPDYGCCQLTDEQIRQLCPPGNFGWEGKDWFVRGFRAASPPAQPVPEPLSEDTIKAEFAKLYPQDIGILELAEHNRDFNVEAIGARHHWSAFLRGARAIERIVTERLRGRK